MCVCVVSANISPSHAEAREQQQQALHHYQRNGTRRQGKGGNHLRLKTLRIVQARSRRQEAEAKKAWV